MKAIKKTCKDISVVIDNKDPYQVTIKIKDGNDAYLTLDEAQFVCSALQELLQDVATSNPPPDSL